MNRTTARTSRTILCSWSLCDNYNISKMIKKNLKPPQNQCGLTLSPLNCQEIKLFFKHCLKHVYKIKRTAIDKNLFISDTRLSGAKSESSITSSSSCKSSQLLYLLKL